MTQVQHSWQAPHPPFLLGNVKLDVLLCLAPAGQQVVVGDRGRSCVNISDTGHNDFSLARCSLPGWSKRGGVRHRQATANANGVQSQVFARVQVLAEDATGS